MGCLASLSAFHVICWMLVTTAAAEEECHRTLDLVFVLDASNSVGSQNFQLMKDTVAEAINILEFGPQSSRVGAVMYSSVDEAMELQVDKQAFKTKLQGLHYFDESTNTNVGIDDATKLLTRDVRKNVPRVMIIVTDGMSSDGAATEKSARIAKEQGIDIWTVGVGSLINKTELITIASRNTQYVLIDSFREFPNKLLALTHLVCEGGGMVTTASPEEHTTEHEEHGHTTHKEDHGHTTHKGEHEHTTEEPHHTEEPHKHTTEENQDHTHKEHEEEVPEVCKDSPTIGEVGYAPYPEDCTKMFQCYHNPHTKKILVVTRQCPFGKFWDQSCLKCKDSWLVDCQWDKCRENNCSNDGEPETHTMEGVCNGYWECRKGRSFPKCCHGHTKFHHGLGCVNGGECWDECGKHSMECADGIGVCDKHPVYTNHKAYREVTTEHGHKEEVKCGDSEFSVTECGCDVRGTFMSEEKECHHYHEMTKKDNCSDDPIKVPIKIHHHDGTLAYRIKLKVSDPHFEIKCVPASKHKEEGEARLRVSGHSDEIQATVYEHDGDEAEASVKIKEPEGDLEVMVVLHEGLLTLAVEHKEVQYVSTVKAESFKICHDCEHHFTVHMHGKHSCELEELKLYNCKPDVYEL